MDIIVDIDGTLADCAHRLHFIKDKPKNWPAFFDACGEDTPIKTVLAMVHSLRVGQPYAMSDNRLIFCSGRPERTRAMTVRWLLENNLLAKTPGEEGHGWPLYMRADNDFREDSIIKRELLAKIRADGFDPVLAVDDRARVCKMWREEGLVCAQVAEGEF